MKVVELTNTTLYKQQFKNALHCIQQSNDLLKDNYANLNPDDFLSFQAIIEDDEIICFSGLEKNKDRWGSYILRCSAKMWIHPNYRFSGLTKFTGGEKFLNSYYIVPNHLKIAKEQGYKCVFMSREKNFKAFKKWSDLVNINANSNFQVLPHIYNVCGAQDIIHDSCKQIVAAEMLDDDGPKVWAHYMNRYIIEDLDLDSRVC